MKTPLQQRKELENQIKDGFRSIPKENRYKFFCDLLKLMDYAKGKNYENFNLD